MDLIYVINELIEKQVARRPAFLRAAKALVLACFALHLLISCRREEDGVFEITDPSKPYVFYDSAFHNAFCCVDATITGEIDGTAKVQIQYVPQSEYWVGGFDLKPGCIDSLRLRQDFFYKKIKIYYIPGTAKKGYVKIITKIL
jgi:hypothetical protein